MEDAKKAQLKTEVDDLHIEKIRKHLLQNIENCSKNGEIEKVEALVQLYIRIEASERIAVLEIEDKEEKLVELKQNRKLAFWKQMINILFAITFVPIGIYLVIRDDGLTGYFLIGAGFSAIGVSGVLSSELIKTFSKKQEV